MRRHLAFAIVFSAVMVVLGSALTDAAPVIFSASSLGPVAGTDGTPSSGPLAASVSFDIDSLDSTKLNVVLTNSALTDVEIPRDVLTAVFFDASFDVTPVSALLAGSTVLFGFPDGGGNVGGEWAYGDGLAGAPNGADKGLSSSGFGLFGSGNFGGLNLDDPDALDGINYGITSAGDDPGTGNKAVTEKDPLIQNSVTFQLQAAGALAESDLASIGNITFQYGTALSEPQLPPPPGVPEASMFAFWLIAGCMGLFAAPYRSLRRK